MPDSLNKTINLSQTGLLYNPQLLDDDTVEKLFVIRQKQFEFLLNKILQENENSIPQHYLIIGQRGMGKTTLLKRIEVELHKEQYRRRFIPLLYREEQYNVKDLAEFWLNTLDALADSLQSEKYLANEVADIDKTIRELSIKSSKIISEETYKYLMEICHNLQRRPVLLIDNIGLIFSRLNNKNNIELWALRKLLSKNGAPIVISGDVTLTDNVNKYNMPFYDFFQTQQLYKLDYEEFSKLLINLANITKKDKKIIDSFQKNSSRQKSLLKLTGGSPRIAVMLFEQIAKGFSSNINDDLEILADAITPLYKARFEELPAQQQIILDAIALNWDAISLKKLSNETHMQNNQLSPQLKRLVDDGWIETTPAYKAKGNAYFISERFFNIYYLIRNSSRRHKDKVYCLSKFLECFYGKEDLEKISDNLLNQGINTSEQMYLYLALSRVKTLVLSQREKIHDKTIETFLKNEDLRNEFDISGENFISKGISLLASKQYDDAIHYFNKAIDINKNDKYAWCCKGDCLSGLRKYNDALACYDKALEKDSNLDFLWFRKGVVLYKLKKHDKAIECYDNAIKINSKQEIYWHNKGKALIDLHSYKDALYCIDQVIKLKPEEDETSLFPKALCLLYLERYEEAMVFFNKLNIINSKNEYYWAFKGEILNFLQQYDESFDCFELAIKLNPKIDSFWNCKGVCLTNMKKYKDAIDSFDIALKINIKNDKAWFEKGNCLFYMLLFKDAVVCYNEAIKINPDVSFFWNQKGEVLIILRYFEKAIECFDKAIELDPQNSIVWSNKGYVLIEMQKIQEAVDALKRSIEFDPENILSKFNLIFIYRDIIGEMNKAIELFNSIDKNKINKNEDKIFVCRYHLHKALFELYKKNNGLAEEYLLHIFDILEKENEISSIAGTYWWIRFGSVVIKLGCGSWLISILEKKAYNVVLSPYYTAIHAMEIENQDRKNGKVNAEIYLNNRAVEISDPAKIIVEEIKKYLL